MLQGVLPLVALFQMEGKCRVHTNLIHLIRLQSQVIIEYPRIWSKRLYPCNCTQRLQEMIWTGCCDKNNVLSRFKCQVHEWSLWEAHPTQKVSTDIEVSTDFEVIILDDCIIEWKLWILKWSIKQINKRMLENQWGQLWGQSAVPYSITWVQITPVPLLMVFLLDEFMGMHWQFQAI